jgi:hypothetical protein
MNNNLNIAEILKDCPKDTKLYSTTFGEVTFDRIDIREKYPIIVHKIDGMRTTFTEEGYYTEYPNSECVLFPSKEMRDWTKFFKRGDIVHTKEGNMYVIFKGWVNDDYTEFNTTINYHKSIALFWTKDVCYTNNFVKASNKEREIFIANAEKYYKGKYNPDTLQVEPIKYKFKSFDKVLVRNGISEKWSIDLFSYYDEEGQAFPYVCLSGRYEYCVPYESNEYFVGKTVNIH